MKTEIFECEIFVICKVLTKFTKILSHKYLKPYGIVYRDNRYNLLYRDYDMSSSYRDIIYIYIYIYIHYDDVIHQRCRRVYIYAYTPQRGFGIYILTPVLFVPKSEVMR